MTSFRLGILAEYIVMILYTLFFYRILHHRMKTYVGEIDLVALRGKQVVFIEVKVRKKGIGAGIVSQSNEEHELQEVNNKLGALKQALKKAEEL